MGKYYLEEPSVSSRTANLGAPELSLEESEEKREPRMTRIRADGPVHLVRTYPRVSA